MITRPYLLTTTSSKSSIGGLMMPSAGEVAAKVCLPDLDSVSALPRKVSLSVAITGIAILSLHQGYQLVANIFDRCVDQGDVELIAGSQLTSRGLEAAADGLRRLGVPADQPAFQLLPRGRGKEDQQGLRDSCAHLPCTRHVDLEQRRGLLIDPLLNRGAGRAVPVPGKLRRFQQFAGRCHSLEFGLGNEEVFAAVHFSRPRRARGNRNGLPDPRAFAPQACCHGALADSRRAGQDRQ